jgi:hypothetical protein
MRGNREHDGVLPGEIAVQFQTPEAAEEAEKILREAKEKLFGPDYEKIIAGLFEEKD